MSLSKDEILDAISDMSVMDVVELVSAMEEKFGVSAAAAVAAVPVAATDEGAGAAVEEQTEFNVRLVSTPDKKVALIKAVRELTGLGLKEAKGLVDESPCLVKEQVSKEEAQEIKAKLEDAGATVELV
ncbi:MAG: 50S ribosomal protein L7/L12 [Gammaproteobacteria bacterium]|nr:50S ribosomal protein L7/L12 [Gammaproteobacteria bacterium]MXX94624.1 50S ribosomal protein L7/L12 [Gammaproteobacteria bacterium]MYF53352.1 50S ribosomal protein L7/L12 [Gammaproteobacteria bacterium]MYK44480.1 50S ribosomal protein L7/L12 [Gammaproteobacteria bacterium]